MKNILETNSKLISLISKKVPVRQQAFLNILHVSRKRDELLLKKNMHKERYPPVENRKGDRKTLKFRP
ncbi:hypothetical protein PR048_022768 [Dryococelus australis]|uniref:Uncharacterized protein n=1 Tax=Dryococelus australis TaxID=614101 RepID=A0ABQ9GS93_9NEOP|nr:hypothetical protein PR048_022768 [Dryococelus australis]